MGDRVDYQPVPHTAQCILCKSKEGLICTGAGPLTVWACQKCVDLPGQVHGFLDRIQSAGFFSRFQKKQTRTRLK